VYTELQGTIIAPAQLHVKEGKIILCIHVPTLPPTFGAISSLWVHTSAVNVSLSLPAVALTLPFTILVV
jgi:hypothetical protein